MKRDMVKMSKEEYREIIAMKDASIDYAMRKADDYMKEWREELGKTQKLQRENGYLMALFDKEGDTQVIKYNGKLYRIVSTQHYKDGCEESLDISLVPVREVG